MFFSNVFEHMHYLFTKFLKKKKKKKSGAVINNNQVDDTKIAKLKKN